MRKFANHLRGRKIKYGANYQKTEHNWDYPKGGNAWCLGRHWIAPAGVAGIQNRIFDVHRLSGKPGQDNEKFSIPECVVGCTARKYFRWGLAGQDAQAGVSARCCAAIASQRAMSAATNVLCDAGMRGHSGTLIHKR
jgi:hypothetical protein